MKVSKVELLSYHLETKVQNNIVVKSLLPAKTPRRWPRPTLNGWNPAPPTQSGRCRPPEIVVAWRLVAVVVVHW